MLAALFLASTGAALFLDSHAQKAGEAGHAPGNYLVAPATPSGEGWADEAAFIAEQNALQRSGSSNAALPSPSGPQDRRALRILLVGDSWMTGEGLTDPDARPGPSLRRSLEDRTARGAVDVVTLALPAASTVEHAQWLASGILDEYDPDVVVLAYNVNDVVPSGREDALCPKEQQPCQGLVVEMSDEYRQCLAGEGSSQAGGVIDEGLPDLAATVTARRCDPSIIAQRTGMHTFEELLLRPDTTRYWPPFLKAVSSIAAAAQRIPVLVAAVDAHGSSASTRPLELLLASGPKRIPLESADRVLDLMRSDKDYWANPGDPHPGAAWTAAFAEDVATAVMLTLGAERVRQATQSGSARDAPQLLAGVFPAAAQVTQGQREARIELPGVDGPCLPIGIAHAAVMLSADLEPGQEVLVTVDGANGRLWLIAYDAKRRLAYQDAGPLEPGKPARLRTRQDLRGFAYSQGSACRSPGLLQTARIRVAMS